MVKAEWGTKRACPKCGAKFYDLQKVPAVCPKCAHAFDPDAPAKKRGRRKDILESTVVPMPKKGKDASGDEEDIELPEFEDIGLMEEIDDIDDIDDVENIKSKPAAGDDEEDDDEGSHEDEDEE